MKKYICVFTLMLLSVFANAQDATDGLRLSQTNLIGTARFRAMSGAFGALGGDLSSLNVNPAGSAVFVNNQISITASNVNINNNSTYFGKKTNDSENSFDLNQAGGVFVFEDKRSDWGKFALGLNYENADNFNNRIYSGGVNPTKSVTQYFVSNANGFTTNTLSNFFYDELNFAGQQASLAYNSYLINPVNVTTPATNTAYVANIKATGNFYQENEYKTIGNNGKLSFNASAEYKKTLYLGINLNSHFTDFRKISSLYEDYLGATNANATQGVQSLRFKNDLHTFGSGFSMQIGAIIKAKDARFGLAYESPTWYTLNDELKQSLATDCANCPKPSYNEDPNVINTYDPYKLKTPSKFTGSFAYIFGKSGLISIDYVYKDYSAMLFKPEADFKSVNNIYKTIFREKASELRVGIEKRIKKWSLRGGYSLEQSPYKNKAIMGDQTGYSAGLGYNFGGTKLDLSYSNSKKTYNDQFLSTGFTETAKIDSNRNNITFTVGFEL